MKLIHSNTLLPLDLAAGIFPLNINLAYASDAPPNIFGKIYSDGAQLWLHQDLARIVLLAALLCKAQSGFEFVLYDGLRTTDAQHAMTQSEIVKNNPQWLEPPRLLSPPGAGAHPRAMAIDIGLRDSGGVLVDMGTDFDFLAQNSAAEFNPAHRAYPRLNSQHRKNRAVLDNAMLRAAECLHLPLFLLPQEWWDFRMPEDIFNTYAPLSDADLPPAMRMVDNVEPLDNPEYYRSIFEKEYERLSAFI